MNDHDTEIKELALLDLIAEEEWRTPDDVHTDWGQQLMQLSLVQLRALTAIAHNQRCLRSAQARTAVAQAATSSGLADHIVRSALVLVGKMQYQGKSAAQVIHADLLTSLVDNRLVTPSAYPRLTTQGMRYLLD